MAIARLSTAEIDRLVRARYDELLVALERFRPAFDAAHAPAAGPAIEVLEPGGLPAALAAAPQGATLLLTPGVAYQGGPTTATNLTIRTKTDLRPGRMDETTALPRLVTPLVLLPGAANLTWIGLEVVAGVTQTAVSIGTDSATVLADLPDAMTFTQCRILGGAGGARIGIAANGRALTVTDSHVANFWEIGRETQAICGWAGVGPTVLRNNYLSAAGENVMFGGGDCRVAGDGPANLTMIGNYCHKPEGWRIRKRTVKNSFELKNMRGALIEYNIFSGAWTDMQAGHAVVFTVRNQGGTRPDSIVRDIVFRYNLIERCEAYALSIQGWDDEAEARGVPVLEQCRDLTVERNLALSGKGVAITRGWDGFRLAENTFAGIAGQFLGFSAPGSGVVSVANQTKRFVVERNLADGGNYGISGDDVAAGLPALEAYAPGAVWTDNAIETTEKRVVKWPAGTTLIPPGGLGTILDPVTGDVTQEAYRRFGAPAGLMQQLEAVRTGR